MYLKGELIERQTTVKAEFDKLEEQKTSISNMQYRLQGQYDLLAELIASFDADSNELKESSKHGRSNNTKERTADVKAAPRRTRTQSAV